MRCHPKLNAFYPRPSAPLHWQSRCWCGWRGPAYPALLDEDPGHGEREARRDGTGHEAREQPLYVPADWLDA